MLFDFLVFGEIQPLPVTQRKNSFVPFGDVPSNATAVLRPTVS